jgi:hypothetical protein
MLGYFPPNRPDEAIYSICARYQMMRQAGETIQQQSESCSVLDM